MTTQVSCQEGLELWQAISREQPYQSMPPLARAVEAVRQRSQNAEQLLDLAFLLCEANLAIGELEAPSWQGLCVLDATGVFSVQGLGRDLCETYGYDFWDFLRALADLGRRSQDPAQYHQCINHNLFTSAADDALVVDRLNALIHHADPRCRGCMVDTAKLLADLGSDSNGSTSDSSTEPIEETLVLTARSAPEAFRGYGRSLKLRLDGQALVKGPYCLNVSLTSAYYWLVGINLTKNVLTQSTLELSYHLELEQDVQPHLRLLMATTAAEPAEPGRGLRHFWLHEEHLPADARDGICIAMESQRWHALAGNPREAYGLKCTAAPSALMDSLPIELILTVEADGCTATPLGQLSLPSVRITKTTSATSQVEP